MIVAFLRKMDFLEWPRLAAQTPPSVPRSALARQVEELLARNLGVAQLQALGGFLVATDSGAMTAQSASVHQKQVHAANFCGDNSVVRPAATCSSRTVASAVLCQENSHARRRALACIARR